MNELEKMCKKKKAFISYVYSAERVNSSLIPACLLVGVCNLYNLNNPVFSFRREGG